MEYKVTPKKRFTHTLEFLQRVLPPPAKILDLGVRNELSILMEEAGYTVINTSGEDLDLDLTVVKQSFDAVTAFEIFEHLLAPYNVLKELKADKLIASVPLKLWFAEAYWNEKDDWDKHYHEFEKKQFDFLGREEKILIPR